MSSLPKSRGCCVDRQSLVGLCAGLVLLTAIGCKHTLERKTIENFAMALEQSNLEDVRESTSSRFKDHALRRNDSLDDWQILDLPEGEITIVDVTDESDTAKTVKVEVGEKKEELTYRLVKPEGEKQWKVDDIFMKQRYDGVIAKRAVTEQMDLFLSVRELLTDLESGDPSLALPHLSTELRAQVDELPPATMSELMEKVVGKTAIESRHSPEAKMDSDNAVVRLDRIQGEMIMSLKREDGKWRLNDMAVESRDDNNHIPSLRKLALVMSVGSRFLTAYTGQNKELMSESVTESFYKNSLAAADLSGLTVPRFISMENTRVKTFPHYAEIVMTQADQVCKLSLVRVDDEEDFDAVTDYRIEDVTLYDLNSDQQILMSSYFNSQAIVQLFAKKVREGDIQFASKLSTPDFSRDVWRALGGVAWTETPLAALQSGVPTITGMNFQGAITKLKVRQGRFMLTWHLRNWDGRTLVDDILIPNTITPESVRETMRVMLPIKRFELALKGRDINSLRRSSSLDFNRQVWSQTDQIPDLGVPYLHYLSSPISKMSVLNDEAIVLLGTEHNGARVLLSQHHQTWLVDEVMLLAGVEPGQQAGLKDTFSQHVAVRDGAFRHYDERRGKTALSTEELMATPDVPAMRMPASNNRIDFNRIVTPAGYEAPPASGSHYQTAQPMQNTVPRPMVDPNVKPAGGSPWPEIEEGPQQHSSTHSAVRHANGFNIQGLPANNNSFRNSCPPGGQGCSAAQTQRTPFNTTGVPTSPQTPPQSRYKLQH